MILTREIIRDAIADAFLGRLSEGEDPEMDIPRITADRIESFLDADNALLSLVDDMGVAELDDFLYVRLGIERNFDTSFPNEQTTIQQYTDAFILG